MIGCVPDIAADRMSGSPADADLSALGPGWIGASGE